MSSTELMNKDSSLPKEKVDAFRVADMAMKTLPEAEAELAVEIDRLDQLGEQDPLLAVNSLVGLMLKIDLELLKCYVPTLLERAHLNVGNLAPGVGSSDLSKADGRALAAMHRCQESVLKLGAARVKINDEIQRRKVDGRV